LWVDGAFDYRAIADYVPAREDMYLAIGDTSVTSAIDVNDDGIYESPDEDFLVTAYQPGKIYFMYR
jgi:hypothetical protein